MLYLSLYSVIVAQRPLSQVAARLRRPAVAGLDPNQEDVGPIGLHLARLGAVGSATGRCWWALGLGFGLGLSDSRTILGAECPKVVLSGKLRGIQRIAIGKEAFVMHYN